MSLNLGDLVGQALGSGTQAAGGLGGLASGLLGQVLGGGNNNVTSALTGLVGGNGLQDIVQKFTGAGLGDIVQSWVGKGENAGINASQIMQGLGSDTVSQLASKVGVAPEQAAGLLSQVLPGLVDKLTPDGAVPAGGVANNLDLGSLLSGFLGKQ